MTKKEIKILLKHGDVSLEGIGMSEYPFQFELSPGNEYYISNEMYHIFQDLFKWYMDGYVWDHSEYFKEIVDKQLKLSSPLKEHQNELFNQLIIAQNKLLVDILGETSNINTIEGKNSTWDLILLKNGYNLIHCLKFEVLSGKSLKDFDFPYKKHLPNFDALDKYFYADEMEIIYKATTIGENIKYLQSLITNLNTPTLSKGIKTNTGDKSILSFEDLFYNNDDVAKVYDVLKRLAIINDKFTFIGKTKGVWIYIIRQLKTATLIKPYTVKIYAQIFNSQFNDFNITDLSGYTKTFKKLEETVSKDLKKYFANIKGGIYQYA